MGSDSSGDPSSTLKFRYSIHGIQNAYHIPTQSGDAFIALRIGISKVNTNPSGSDIIFSPYHYGIASGYDYNINNFFSVGFEGSFLHVFQSSTNQNGLEVTQKAFNIMSFLVAFQVKF
jgi:hypothetical protein